MRRILVVLVAGCVASAALAQEELQPYDDDEDVPVVTLSQPPVTATRAASVLEGRFGIGAHALLSAETGVSLRFFAGEALAGEVILRPALTNLGATPAFTLAAAARVESVFVPANDGFISAFGGLGVLVLGDVIMLVEAGLKGEYLLWADMSIFAEVGLNLSIDFGDTAALGFGSAGAPFGAAGFTLWLP